MAERKNRALGITLVLLICAGLSPAAQEETWNRMSKYGLTVIVSQETDISRIYNNLRSRRTGMKTAPRGISRTEAAGLLLDRMKAILDEVQVLCNVEEPLNGPKRIVILRDLKQLERVFKNRYNRNLGNGLSFYDRLSNTVYTTETVLQARILAHEFTHLVNDIAFRGTMSEQEDERIAHRNEVYF